MKEKVLKKFFYIIAGVFATVMLFTILHDMATIERGYEAIGGEICVFFLPFVYFVIKYR